MLFCVSVLDPLVEPDVLPPVVPLPDVPLPDVPAPEEDVSGEVEDEPLLPLVPEVLGEVLGEVPGEDDVPLELEEPLGAVVPDVPELPDVPVEPAPPLLGRLQAPSVSTSADMTIKVLFIATPPFPSQRSMGPAAAGARCPEGADRTRCLGRRRSVCAAAGGAARHSPRGVTGKLCAPPSHRRS